MVEVNNSLKIAPAITSLESSVTATSSDTSSRITSVLQESLSNAQSIPNNAHQLRAMPNSERLGTEVLEKMKMAIEESKKAIGKDVFALVGVTGTGKSTAVNALSGIEVVKNRRCVVVKNPEEQIAKIGTSRVHSQTEFVEIIKHKDSPFTFADCGGFLDTGGINKQIVVETSVKFTMENAESVNLVLCFDSKLLEIDRGVHFYAFLDRVFGNLLKGYEDYPHSVLLMFTKPEKMNERELIEILEDMREELNQGPRKKYFDFLLRDGGEYVTCLEPTSKNSCEAVKSKLSLMKPIRDTNRAFELSYSPGVKIKLLEEMTTIAAIANELIEQHNHLIDNKIRNQKDISDLNVKIQVVKESLNILGDGNSNAQAIKEAQECLIHEHESIIQENQKKINDLEGKVSELTAQIEIIDKKITSAGQDGEKEILYWKDTHQQEAIVIISKIITRTETTKSGGLFGRGSSSSTYSEEQRGENKPIHRDFRYQGSTISRVTRRPDSNAYWSNENKTDNAYSIHYKTADGEAADATVEVFVKRKDTPEEKTKIAAFYQEKATLSQQIFNLALDVGKYQSLINSSKIILADKEHNLKDLHAFEKNLGDLEAAKQEVQEQLFSTQMQLSTTVDKINSHKRDFQLLESYLSISKDHELSSKEIIRKCLSHLQKYNNASHVLEEVV